MINSLNNDEKIHLSLNPDWVQLPGFSLDENICLGFFRNLSPSLRGGGCNSPTLPPLDDFKTFIRHSDLVKGGDECSSCDHRKVCLESSDLSQHREAYTFYMINMSVHGQVGVQKNAEVSN